VSVLEPGLWPILLAAPLVGLALWALDRSRARRLVRAIGPRPLANVDRVRRRVGRTAFATAMLLATVAVLQPVWGETTRNVERTGVDVVVCLDVSRSMLAGDVAPSRLARAQSELRALAARHTGDRLGLVVFAGEARLATPLTRDMESFSALVGLATPLSVGKGGTDLGIALTTALEALRGATGEHEVVLLVTDGEDHEERGLRVARTFRERGITVHCVGLGTERGAKIPVGGAFLRDRAGQDVVSALDPATLRRIAETTGGEFARSVTNVYERRIGPMARKSFEARERRERENRFQWPLLGAFFFWMLDLCLHDRKRR